MAGISISLHNFFELQCIDKDGNVKQTAKAYNVVTPNFWAFANYGGVWNSSIFGHMAIGTGIGAIDPTGSTMIQRCGDPIECTTLELEYAYPISTMTRQATFPATTAYVGVITEVGFSQEKTTYLVTHALLQDAEGNTITINKTSTDILIVTGTVYLNFAVTEPIKLIGSAANNNLLTAILGGKSVRYGWGTDLPDVSMEVERDINNQFYDSIGTLGSYDDVIDVVNHTKTAPTARIGTTSGNYGFANYLLLKNYNIMGYIELPNTTYFAPFKLSPMLVGKGDGIKTEFACPIPDFIEATEEVKVNNVLLTRGADYTVDPLGNSIGHISSKCAWSRQPHTITGGTSGNTSYPVYWGSLYRGNNGYYPTPTTPVICVYGTAITCNCLYITKLISGHATYESKITNLCFEYSPDEGTTWIKLIQITPLDTQLSFADNTPYVFSTPFMFFDEVTSTHWRFTCTYSNRGSYGQPGPAKGCFFGRVGQGLKFAVAPAAEATITIAAQVDRPWKSSDYVIDSSYVLRY